MDRMSAWMRNQKHRLELSVAVGMLAAILTAGQTRPVLAWWGTMYPKFCFAEGFVENEEENRGMNAGNSDKPIKISFWLAKALDW